MHSPAYDTPMAPLAPIRFGLVGAGGIAQTYSSALQGTARAQLTAVADLRVDAAESMAAFHQAAYYGDATEMFHSGLVDAVVVCTPPDSHPELCVQAMQAGLHVLCEKPLAINLVGARQILHAAEVHQRRFAMASKFRFVEDVIRAKALVTSGILGEIILLENTFAGRIDMHHRWNSNPELSGGGVLIDNGTHSVDLVRYLLGPLADLQVVEGKRIQGLPVEDTVHLFARTVEGVMAHIDLSWSLNKESPYYLSLYGSQGTVLVGWRDSKYRRVGDQEWVVFGRGYDKLKAFTRQIENFVASIHGEEAMLIRPVDALASVQVIEAAYQALRTNDWVKINNEIPLWPVLQRA